MTENSYDLEKNKPQRHYLTSFEASRSHKTRSHHLEILLCCILLREEEIVTTWKLFRKDKLWFTPLYSSISVDAHIKEGSTDLDLIHIQDVQR